MAQLKVIVLLTVAFTLGEKSDALGLNKEMVYSNDTEAGMDGAEAAGTYLMSAPSDNIVPACPSEFVHLSGSHGCYKFVMETLTYDVAYQRCTNEHPSARLVAVETMHEHKAIQNYLRQNGGYANAPCTGRFWMGLERYDRHSCGNFFWRKRMGSSTYSEDVDFTAWGPGEPSCNNKNEGCAHYSLTHSYMWNDQSCSSPLCFICEAPPVCSCDKDGCPF